jgi:CubicO group peptidase (beta-lactamase class C family)
MLGFAELPGWLDGRARQNLFSGVALVRRGDETLFGHAAGLAHRGHSVPITIHTRFQVASVGKMITAATALALVEAGELSLHRPVAEVLAAPLRPASLDDRHTLHHLLSHTSGLPNYFDDEDDMPAPFMSAIERIPASRARGPRDILPLFADLPLASAPGEYRYCDANFVLVGLLIEEVAGRPFAEVATDLVLAPTGMGSSGFFDVDLEPAGFATGYLVTDDPPERWRSNVYGLTASAMPDGGMTSTAHDLDRFLAALRSGTLLSAETVERMLTPHGRDPDGVDAAGYGMELAVEHGRVTVFGHSGSDPGVAAYIAHFVDAGVTVTVLCNYDRGAKAVIDQLLAALGLHDPRD